jgi:fructose-1,6-bisphosphatase/inositol monophosphatase family enzyme
MITPTLNAAVETIMREVSRDVILPHYQSLTAAQIVSKAVNDVVTVADQESEAILTERLTALLPDASVVGEEATFADESELLKLKDRLCWIVDPLDGTNNFAAGKPPFGMLIALADRGETLGGWILDCLTGRFCRASLNGGAWVNEEHLTAQATEVAPHYRMVDIPRCAAEQYPRLALGQNDVAVFERTLPWDHAAGALFLNEAGGKCARPDGTPYRVDQFDRKGLIGAASPALFEALANRLSALED